MAAEQKTIAEQIKHAVDSDTASRQMSGAVEAPVGTPENPSDDVLTLANLITLCRLILTLCFLFLFPKPDTRGFALACYIVAAITDFLDGQIARRTQTVSWTGKIMDPIMDRILLFTGVIGLVLTGELPVWVALVVVGRDAFLAAGALILKRYERRPIDVVFVGKLATALLMFGFCDMLIGVPVVGGLGLASASWLPGLNGTPCAVGIFFIYIGLVFSLLTAAIYCAKGIRIIREKGADED